MKYIIYCRKSRDEADKQVLSIEAQIAELFEFAKREKLEILEVIEEAKTAKAPGREKFAKVMQLIERGRAGGILAWHPDRLARNSIDGGKIIYLLDTGKLKDLKFPTFWFDNTPQGKFMLNIAFGQSKYYIDNLSENVKRGLRQKIRNGVWPGKTTYGYSNNPKTRGIDIVPNEARAIKGAFELFCEQDKTFTDISNYFLKLGIKKENGKPLHLNQVRKILSNKFYIGILKYNGEYHLGTHKTFISKELFNKVQEKLNRKVRQNSKLPVFTFLGLLRCKECGASVTAERHVKFYKGTNRSATYIYYRCTKKMGPCSQKMVTAQELEDQLRKIVLSVSIPTSWRDRWLGLVERDEISEKGLSDVRMRKLKEEASSLDKKMDILLDSYLEGDIEGDNYKRKKNELFEEKIKIQEKIEVLEEGGSRSLEPLREFINVASSCDKIARAKNNQLDLANLAKHVGSNFFLEDGCVYANFKKGFDSIRPAIAGLSPAELSAGSSLSVGMPRIERGLLHPQRSVLPLYYIP